MSRRSAFTLVELSIVLVVLGLLMGGIFAGQALIRASQLRTTATELDKYRTAIHAFEDKYNALPGDIRNATDFWGAHIADNNNCADSNVASVIVTCNGDGSGFIADGGIVSRAQWYEAYRAWQHMSNAGLIAGEYTGTSYTGRGALQNLPGINAPASRLDGTASWGLRSFVEAEGGGGSDWFPTPVDNFLTLGNERLVGEGSGPVLTPEEAWGIDLKLDDGKPGTGVIMTFKGGGANNPNCTVDGSTDTDYATSYKGMACAFNILLQTR